MAISEDEKTLPLFADGTATVGDASPVERRRQSRSRAWRIFALVAAWTTISFLYTSRSTWSTETSSKRHTCGSSSCERNEAWLIRAKHGAVASENGLCSEIGVKTLKKGGNAVDAAISATLCIGVTNMFSAGIGGGGFMTVRIPTLGGKDTSKAYTVDFRETAPAAANETMYVGQPINALFGGLAVGVPGELRGLEEMHRRWGTLSWKELVMPSVELAKGWRVSKELERRIEMFGALMHNSPDWKAIFAPKGCLLREGDLIQRIALSRTLAKIAEEGPDAFYSGPIAESLVAKVQEAGGIMTLQDFADYKAKVEPALEGSYRGKRVYTTHAPTSGPALLHMLNLLEQFEDFVEEGRSSLNMHRVIEIMKFGFAARTKISDPAFVHRDSARILEIPTKEYARRVFLNITDDRTHPPEYYQPVYDVPVDHGTSHVSVVDKNEMAVSITSTVNIVFGSQVLDPVTGVIMNDEMDDFSTPGVPNSFGLYPSPYNYPQPGKRPLSSIAPTIMEHLDGSFAVTIGGSGGSRIFPSVFQTLVNLDWGLDASEAVEYGRVHDQLFPLLVEADNVFPSNILEDLKVKGHNITVADISRVAAAVQVITKEGSTIQAASDSRKRGKAAGY
ncbi:gamma-glutamyltranspeptidase [Irpex rosettiformis]|uniref:Gamma-glutamyltranspeptidase n=1 Tax=Irpex rosettiformis TaxID=378272 RepID=A0ACB8U139_9APHY|nr:gamma-glutamyltranspeptidase [Irpex rosettiformis]